MADGGYASGTAGLRRRRQRVRARMRGRRRQARTRSRCRHRAPLMDARRSGPKALLRHHECDRVRAKSVQSLAARLCRGSRPYPRVLGADSRRSTRVTVRSLGSLRANVETNSAGACPDGPLDRAIRQWDAPSARSRCCAEGADGGRLPPGPGARPLLGRAPRGPARGRSAQRKARSVTGCTIRDGWRETDGRRREPAAATSPRPAAGAASDGGV